MWLSGPYVYTDSSAKRSKPVATIQAKTSRGHKYWYIVESRRIDGKPRPVVLAYLGKAEDLLRRLEESVGENVTLKSWSHGAVAALLRLAGELDVVSIINGYVRSQRPYMAAKPLRNKLTVGITLLLAGIGRACMPTSKRGWWSWAQTTSCEHLLRVKLSKLDSQHFWDLMDALPEEAIDRIERDLLGNVMRTYSIGTDTLLYDTTNFYTFIASANDRCDIAQRGKNKQKRYDLRQVGLALVVSRDDYIPLFHYTYRGNINDSIVFKKVIKSIKKRMQDLKLDLDKHTLVFDRGCNSKANLAIVRRLGLHYVGALTPSNHQDVLNNADGRLVHTDIGDTSLQLYREERVIWGEERTILVFVSERLKAGQLRGIYQMLRKKKSALRELQRALGNPKAKKRTRGQLEAKIEKLLEGQFMDGLISYNLSEVENGRFILTYRTSKKDLDALEDRLGFRILMTDRHEWSTADIVKAFYGQSTVESAFKDIKNPYHLAITPEFHWTDQKIRVHYFSCVLGYLLAALIWRDARTKAHFNGTLDTLLDILNRIRLGTILEKTGKKGRPKARYQLEERSPEEELLAEALNLKDLHLRPPQIKGVGVYTRGSHNRD
jgi:transposase